MRERFENLVTALKTLTQVEDPNAEPPVTVTLPMAEDEYYTRPDTVSYGLVSLDFEAGQLHGEDVKQDTSYQGSVDLFSLARAGAGWVPLIEQTLTTYCDGCWSLNSHMYERETNLFHWEWVFEI